MQKNKNHTQRIIWLLIALPFVVAILSMGMGRYPISFTTVMNALINPMPLFQEGVLGPVETVIYNIRLPRILLACMVGSCLSVAGAAYQGVFQNPMASPDLLGATSGAAFGAALAILFGGSYATIAGTSFFFSLLAVGIVFLIGRVAPGNRIVNLILAGMMIGSMFTSATSLIKLVADPSDQLPAITYWLMGSFNGASRELVAYICIPMALGLLPLFALRWRMNVLSVGDEVAQSIGVNANRLRLAVILSATLITAASVSVSGMIGWVGLVMPHLCRKLVGSNFAVLLPASMFAGATFMLVIDTLSRNLFPVEIPIGILTAFVGAPFFTYLIFRKETLTE